MNTATPEFWQNLPAILTAFAALVGVVGGVIMSILTYRRQGIAIAKADEGIQASKVNEQKIDVIGVNVDGKMDKLLAAREDAAGARGELKERDAQRGNLVDANGSEISSTDKGEQK